MWYRHNAPEVVVGAPLCVFRKQTFELIVFVGEIAEGRLQTCTATCVGARSLYRSMCGSALAPSPSPEAPLPRPITPGRCSQAVSSQALLTSLPSQAPFSQALLSRPILPGFSSQAHSPMAVVKAPPRPLLPCPCLQLYPPGSLFLGPALEAALPRPPPRPFPQTFFPKPFIPGHSSHTPPSRPFLPGPSSQAFIPRPFFPDPSSQAPHPRPCQTNRFLQGEPRSRLLFVEAKTATFEIAP